MKIKTSVVCDCELDANTIEVSIDGHAVEVCCDDCAQKLREAEGQP